MILHPPVAFPVSDSEASFALFDAVPASMWVLDALTLRFLDVNAFAINAYGYTRDEFLSMRVTDLHPPDAERENAVARSSRVGFTFRGEFQHLWRDGTIRHVSLSSYDIRYFGCDARLVIVDDITDRVLAERTREMLLAAVEQVHDPVLLLRAALVPGHPPHIAFVNCATEQVLGVKRGDLLQAQWFVHPTLIRNRGAIRRFVARLHLPEATQMDISWHTPDDRNLRLDVLASPVKFSEGRVIDHWIVVARDITARRAAAERSAQAQRLESLGLLAGSIAHDFGNLVQVVLGFTQLATEQLGDRAEAALYVQNAHDAAEKAAALSRQLLAFSRRQSLSPQCVDLRGLLKGITPVLFRLAGHQVRVTLQLSDLPAFVWADTTQMEQVLMNLVVNARDAQPNGGAVRITLDVYRGDAKANTRLPAATEGVVRLCVADEGPGMPRDIAPRVFEPFFTTKPHGTGLGLSTVHGIVTQSGGEIALHSPPGRGLTVEILMPYCEIPQDETTVTIAVHVADRTRRLQLAGAFQRAGVRTRLSSRLAELAKNLADGAVTAIVTTSAESDTTAVQPRAGACAIVHAAPGDDVEQVVARVLKIRSA